MGRVCACVQGWHTSRMRPGLRPTKAFESHVSWYLTDQQLQERSSTSTLDARKAQEGFFKTLCSAPVPQVKVPQRACGKQSEGSCVFS